MTEAERYTALGLTPPESTGANEREAADPAGEQELLPEESENTPEAADPAEEPDEGPEEPDAGEGENEQEAADPAPERTKTKTAQDRATNARNAARRREAEMQEKLEAARKEEREKYEARIKKVLGRAGFKDGETRIEDLDGLESYLEKSELARIGRELKAGELTPESLQSMVERAVSRAQEFTVESPAAVDGVMNDRAAFEMQVEAELAEIGKYDPSVKTVADLRRLDRAEEFMNAVTKHGHSFLDAYKFVYADKIAEAKAKTAAAAAARKARNDAAGKDHLRGTGSRGAGDHTVPESAMAKMRRMLPGVSDEELRKGWLRHQPK